MRRIGHSNVRTACGPEWATNGTSGASGMSHTAHNPTAAHNVDLPFPRGVCTPPVRTPSDSTASNASFSNRASRIRSPARAPDGVRAYVSIHRIARAARERVRHARHGGGDRSIRLSSAEGR